MQKKIVLYICIHTLLICISISVFVLLTKASGEWGCCSILETQLHVSIILAHVVLVIVLDMQVSAFIATRGKVSTFNATRGKFLLMYSHSPGLMAYLPPHLSFLYLFKYILLPTRYQVFWFFMAVNIACLLRS